MDKTSFLYDPLLLMAQTQPFFKKAASGYSVPQTPSTTSLMHTKPYIMYVFTSFALIPGCYTPRQVRMKEVGRLAPGVGHYDAQPDKLRPKRDKISYILNKDRPNAPSFKVVPSPMYSCIQIF